MYKVPDYILSNHNFSLEVGITKIGVYIPNGVYKFFPESAIGKTYICNKLTRLEAGGYPVLGVTYDCKNQRQLSTQNVKEIKLAVFDRYDMYQDKYYEEIKEIAKNGVVILSYMAPVQSNSFYLTDYCTIEMVEDQHIILY